MTTVIRNETIVTHDLTYAADARMENGVSVKIGNDLWGTTMAVDFALPAPRPVQWTGIPATGV